MEKWVERRKSWLWFASGALILLAILCWLLSARTQISAGSNNLKPGSAKFRPNPSQWLVFRPMESNNVWSEQDGELELNEESKISVLKAAIELTASKSFNVSNDDDTKAILKKRARRSTDKQRQDAEMKRQAKTRRAFRNESK